MKKSDFYDAFSGIDEELIADSERFEDITSDFRRARSRTIGLISSLCSFAFALFLAVGVFGSGMQKRPDTHNKLGNSTGSSLPSEYPIYDITDPTEQASCNGDPIVAAETAAVGEHDTTNALQPTQGDRSDKGTDSTDSAHEDETAEHEPSGDNGSPDAPPKPTENTSEKPVEKPTSPPAQQVIRPTDAVQQTTLTPSVSAGDNLLIVNNISAVNSGAPKYYDPEKYDRLEMSRDESADYFGIDLSGFGDSLLTDSQCELSGENYAIVTEKNGTIVFDAVTAFYTLPDDSKVKLSAGRVIKPCDEIYETETRYTSHISETEAIVSRYGSQYDNMAKSLYCADFERDGVNFRITAESVTYSEFTDILQNIITTLEGGAL